MNIFEGPRILYAKGSGGGGGAGVVDYPGYMKDFHGDLLNHTGADSITSSLTDVMNVAIGNSPFTSMTAYNPDDPIAEFIASVGDLETLVDLLSSGTGLDTLISNVLDQTRIDASVLAYANDLADRLTSEVLPRFEAGMRDINAVVSSAFIIGKSIIESSQTRQVAKYSADLNMKVFSDDALQVIALKLEYQKQLTHITVEANRIKIVAKKEEFEYQDDIDEADASWDLGVFQHGGNLLAGIGGGVGTTDKKKKNKLASAIGGAMSGAVAGAMVAGAAKGSSAGHFGAVIGAVIGAAASLME